MHFNVAGFLALGLAALVFSAACRFLKNKQVGFRLLVLLGATLASVPALLAAIYYLHVLPERAWFYELRAWPGSEYLVVFLGLAAGCFATFLPRILLGVPLFGLLLIGSVPYLKPLLRPLDDDQIADRWQGEACLQSSASTCGPASVCTVMAALGRRSSEREIARAAYSYAGGTEAWYLARYLRQQGFQAHFEFQESSISHVQCPAVVGVTIGGMGHFIAVLKIDDNQVTFVDPLSGEEHISLPAFERRYQFTGFFMTVSRS